MQNISTNLKNVLSLLTNNAHIDTTSFTLAIEEISRDLIANIKKYGTQQLDDLLYLCIGNNIQFHNDYIDKYRLLSKCASPCSYTMIEKHLNNSSYACVDILDIDNEDLGWRLTMVYKGRYYGWGWLVALLWLMAYFLWPFTSSASNQIDGHGANITVQKGEKAFTN